MIFRSKLVNKYKERPCIKFYQLKDEIVINIRRVSGGILHIGAHKGVEAALHNQLGLPVLWIEANPNLMKDLSVNISRFKEQQAICALLGDEDRSDVPFHIANNDGMSSSIFRFGKDMNHVNLAMNEEVLLNMKRLDSLFQADDLSIYGHWIIDVQGAELSVLQGAGALLDVAKSIEIEVSTKEEYLGGATWTQVSSFLKKLNFFPLWSPAHYSHEDIVFVRY